MLYEVEIRLHFENRNAAFKKLPFLRSSLEQEITWNTTIFGLKLFKAGKLLRRGVVSMDNETRYYLGWKGPDTGSFANIRRELNEEITDGIMDSGVMKMLGGKSHIKSPEEAVLEMERLGHHPFMSFRGKDANGYYPLLELHIKLMTCAELKWPLLVELEKMAGTEEEALQYELELQEICRRLHVLNHLVREEPPTLLYETVANKQSGKTGRTTRTESVP